MNEKRVISVLLIAILITMVAVVAVRYFPERRLIVPLGPNVHLYSLALPDGTQGAEWINQPKKKWRCNPPPAGFSGNYFPCDLIVELTTVKNKGIDLSQYSHLNLKIHYQGSANKMRIAIRNFNSAYSRINDDNSTKFNAVHIHTSQLKNELVLSLSSFAVSEWWLELFNIPFESSLPDMSNATQVTLDFSEILKPGTHELTLENLEFRGDWISAEHWYLFIICSWMLGIFVFAVIHLIKLREQTIHDTEIINELSSSNEQLKIETNKFRRLSTVDPLTQAYNRFGIDQIVTTLTSFNLEKERDQNTPIYSLIILDIDHFKRVNDNRGHDAGDRVLQGVSSIIQQHISANDFLGRWGGEEFVIIMPNTTKDSAMKLAETIREAVSVYCFEPDNPLTVTVSLGVGDKFKGEDFASTFKRTDSALYKAKHQGRNCCIYADSEFPHNK